MHDMGNAKPRVIAYIRVSTAEQAEGGVSLAAQESKLRAYCEALDLVLVRVESDPGVSAKTLDRPGLQRALAALRRREADALVITKLDRLTRSVRDLGELLETTFAAKRGAGLISLGESVDTTTAAGELVLNLLVSVSQWERRAIGERTSTAMRHMRAEGRFIGGSAPFGYALAANGETLVEVAGEQAVIIEARELRRAGLSLRKVATELDRRGFRARTGRVFDAKQVQRMTEAA
jgi:DNA invertase Pin-like site-specific DNA recombinase